MPVWMFLCPTNRLYPEVEISCDIATEAQRMELLQQATALAAAKARLRLHAKRLYGADGAAVHELLKLATLLHRAACSVHATEKVC
jgi:clusterin-associated protein 1